VHVYYERHDSKYLTCFYNISNIHAFYERDRSTFSNVSESSACSKQYERKVIDSHFSPVMAILQQSTLRSVIDLYQQSVLNIPLFNSSVSLILIYHIIPLFATHKCNSHAIQRGTLLLSCVCLRIGHKFCSTLNLKFMTFLVNIRTCMLIKSASLPCHEFFMNTKVIMCVVIF
jgi:hypothetical protein